MESKQRQQGFTFIEFLVVLTILGILASFSGPNIAGSLQAWKADRFSRSIWSVLRDVQNTAQEHDRTIQVKIETGSHNGKLSFLQKKKSDSGENWEDAGGFSTISTPDNVKIRSVGNISDGFGCFQFGPNGSVSDVYTTTKNSTTCTDGSAKGDPHIHISSSGVEESSTCDWNTVYLMRTFSVGQPILLNYAAGGSFSYTLGDKPSC